MTAIQIFGVIFSISMVYLTYFYYRRKIFLFQDVLLWGYVWVLLIFAVAFPEKLNTIIQPLEIVRVLDLLTVFILFALVFIIFARSRYNDRRIETIVKEIALKEKEEK
jgi:hypothetical protein